MSEKNDCRDYVRCTRPAKAKAQPCCGCASYEPEGGYGKMPCDGCPWDCGYKADDEASLPPPCVRTERRKREKLERAVNWAMGCGDTFAPKADGAGAYYWRPELAKRAGMTYSQKLGKYTAARIAKRRAK